MLFADRLEVWNPGERPPLTAELLRQPHASIPRNPLIAELFSLALCIEKAGSGTLNLRRDKNFLTSSWKRRRMERQKG
jgi:ATP-dependent DNA helicase RecG